MATFHHLTKSSTTEVTLEFPGIKCYVESIEGKTFLETLSIKYNCNFEFSSKDKKPKAKLETKCLLYESFLCHGFNFHIVKGFVEDIQCQLTIQFMPSNNQEICYAEGRQSSLYQIHLPPWRIQGTQQISHLQLLRTSLSESINHVIQVAQQYQSQTIVFSTEKISQAEYPFPLDVIAHAVFNSLCQSYQQSVNPVEWISLTPDIYVCEPTREAVFKAFSFTFNKYSPILCTGTDENMCSKGPRKCHGRETESDHKPLNNPEKQHHSYSKTLNKKGKDIKKKLNNFVNKFTTSKDQNLDTNHKPKSSESCTHTRIKKTTMKIYSQSLQDNEKSAADFKNNLEQLMKENTKELTVNEQQMTELEKMMRNAEELPVQYFLKKTANFLVEQRKSRGRRKHERNASYMEEFKETLLKVSGLQKKSVSDFVDMIMGPSQKKSSSVTTCFHEESRKIQEKEELNSSLSALRRECQEYFCWMIVTQQNKGGNIDLEPYAYSDILEECYRNKEGRTILDTTVIDFQTMTIKVDRRKQWVIRSVDTKCATNCPVPPGAWEVSTHYPYTYRLKHVSNDDSEFTNLDHLLKDYIKQCEIKQITRVENLRLWESYHCKKHRAKSSDKRMWHRILATCQTLVGQYGLHKHFSAMPQQAQALGDSVVLVDSPNDCLSQHDFIEEDEIHLVLAWVLHGEKEERQYSKSLSPVQNVKSEHTIFSSAEAYPCHIVAIRVKPGTSLKQHH